MSIDISKIRTFDQVLGNIDGSGTGLRDYISKLTLTKDGIDGKTIDTTDVEFIIQAFLAPASLEFANLYFYLDFLQRAVSVQSLLEVDQDPDYKLNLQNALHNTTTETQDLIDTIFDYHGNNVNVPRRQQTQATGFQIFSRTQAPTFDILIPAGTKVSTTSTSTTPAVVEQTVSDVTMLAALASSYLNPLTGVYEILAPVIAALPGANGNQNAGAVNIIVSSVNGITGTRNPTRIQGGSDKELNELYAPRILAAIPGANTSTATGIFNTAFQQQDVSDVAVVGAGDPLMLRDGGAGGKVDVYLQTNLNDLLQVTDEKHPYIGATDYIFDKQPVEANITNFPITVKVFNILGTQVGVLTLTTHFTFLKDRTGNEWSARADDKITVTAAGGIFITGLGGTELRMTYTYDTRIESVQAVFDDPDGHDATVDILVRKSKSAIFDMSINGKQLTGFTNQQIVDSMTSIISTMFSIGSRILGLSAIISVISAAIQNEASLVGITEIVSITFTLSDGNDDLAETSAVIDVNGDAAIDRVEFLQLGTITFTNVP